MTVTLFTNRITTTAPVSQVQSLLTNLNKLALWNPAISGIQVTANGAEIVRSNPAINQQESVQIQMKNQQVIYSGQGPHLSYQLLFQLTTAYDQTVIQEEFIVLQSIIPISLLNLMKSQIKNAFQNNLIRFVQLVEK